MWKLWDEENERFFVLAFGAYVTGIIIMKNKRKDIIKLREKEIILKQNFITINPSLHYGVNMVQ